MFSRPDRFFARRLVPALVAVAAAFCLPFTLLGAGFTANWQQNPIYAGQSATLELRFETQPSQAPEVRPVPGLTIGATGSSQQVTIINGAMRRTLSITYEVTAPKPGDYQLGAIVADIGGQKVAVPVPSLKVLPASADPREAQLRQFAFLRLNPPKKEVYVGELFPVQIELFVQAGREVQTPKLQSDGFTFGKVEQPQQDRVQINGVIYNRVIFQMSAVAARTGNLTIGPAETSLILRIPSGRRDPFDIFGSGYQEVQRTLTSELHPITVLPLPKEDVPADFNGAVGSFNQFTVEAGMKDVAVGDPITLKITIAGSGALDGLAIDGPSKWRGFRAYPPTANVTTSGAMGLQGQKVIEQVVVPENTDVKELPALLFSFFDPAQKAYRTLTQPAVPIVVRPSASVAVAPTVVSGTNQPAGEFQKQRDIINIKQRAGTLATVQTPWVTQTSFWITNSIPALICAVLFWRRKQAEALANNPRLRRRREVEKLIAQGFKELREHAVKGHGDAFYATTFRLLQERLGERLDMPAVSITEAVIDERLRPMKVDEAVLNELHSLFQACNQARYAPQSDSKQLDATLERVQSALQAAATLEAKP